MDDYGSIMNIMGLYFQYTDDGDWESWSSLVTEDFRLDVNGRVTQGREECKRDHIKSHGPRKPHGRHFMANPVIEVMGDTARATFDWQYVAEFSLGMPTASKALLVVEMGRSFDDFRRENDRWYLSARDIRPRFFHPDTVASG